MRIFVTGGAGFIGSAHVRYLIAETDHEILVFDALTYAGNLTTIASIANDLRYRFVRGDVADAAAVRDAVAQFRPGIVTHLAAEIRSATALWPSTISGGPSISSRSL